MHSLTLTLPPLACCAQARRRAMAMKPQARGCIEPAPPLLAAARHAPPTAACAPSSRTCAEVDGGRFAVKRVVGEQVVVEADCFADGHDAWRCVLRWRRAGRARVARSADGAARQRPLARAASSSIGLGRYRYTVAPGSTTSTWRHDLGAARRRRPTSAVAALVGARSSRRRRARARRPTAALPSGRRAAAAASDGAARWPQRIKALALDETLARWRRATPIGARDRATRSSCRSSSTASAPASALVRALPALAGPRPAAGTAPSRREARLDYVAAMGFDVLYLPPIHPIGRDQPQGAEQHAERRPDDVGQPVGDRRAEGGHKAVHPELGTLEDFARWSRGGAGTASRSRSTSPSSARPTTRTSRAPEWFRLAPDGTIQYAENPPKKYQDIYPFDFETDDWRRCGAS
jgi:starch synthase (maltosyl-transferring)